MWYRKHNRNCQFRSGSPLIYYLWSPPTFPSPQQPLMRNRSEGVGIVCRGLSGQVGLVFTPCSPHLPYHLSSCVGVYTRPAPTGPRQPGGSGSTAASPLRLCHLWVGILIPLPNGGGTSDFRIRSTTSHIQLDGVWRNHT